MFFGRVENPENKQLKDLSVREWCVLVPVLLFIVWIGVHPGTFLDKSATATRQVVQRFEDARRAVQLGVSEQPADGGGNPAR